MDRRHATPNQPPTMTKGQIGVVSFIAGMMLYATLDLMMRSLI